MRKPFQIPVRTLLLATAVIGFLGVFLIWPIAHSFQRAMTDEQGFSLLYLKALFQEPRQLEAILRGFMIAALVTVACFVVALPLASVMARYRFPGKALFSGLILVPLILPPFVGAVGMKLVLARCGALSTLLMRLGWTDHPVDWLGAYPLLGVILLETLHLFPVLYLNLVAALANIDPSLEEAAANLGASPGRVIRRITLPLVSAHLVAGGILCFVFSMLEVSDSLILAQTETFYPITKAIYTLMEGLENGVNVAAALGVWAMALLASALLWASCLLGNRMGQMFRAG